jgi:hypothetical protein
MPFLLDSEWAGSVQLAVLKDARALQVHILHQAVWFCEVVLDRKRGAAALLGEDVVD